MLLLFGCLLPSPLLKFTFREIFVVPESQIQSLTGRSSQTLLGDFKLQTLQKASLRLLARWKRRRFPRTTRCRVKEHPRPTPSCRRKDPLLKGIYRVGRRVL